MSRSRKKPYYPDQDTERKRLYNRALRRSKEDMPDGKHYKKERESWDIRDYSFYCPKDPKAYRK